LHPVLVLRSSCARRGITPAFWLRTPLGVGPAGLPPARHHAARAQYEPLRLTLDRPHHFPGSRVIGGASLPATPQATGPRRLFRVTRRTTRTFNANTRRGSLALAPGTRARFPWPSPSRYRLGTLLASPAGGGIHDDTYSGFSHVADRAVPHAPLHTRLLDHARGRSLPETRRLPGPGSHRQAALNLSPLRHADHHFYIRARAVSAHIGRGLRLLRGCTSGLTTHGRRGRSRSVAQ
jgi:hypothetical protein